MEIRSYRRVFDLERRIYRIDRLRLNPAGVPVRGIVYFLALLAATLVLSRAPLLAVIANAVPWYARDVVTPGLLASLLAVVRIDGRSFHLAARAMLRFRAELRRLDAALRARCARRLAGRLRVAAATADDAAGRLRCCAAPLSLQRARRRAGERPASVVCRAGVRARIGLGPHVVLCSGPGGRTDDEVLVLERGARLRVR